MSNTGCPCISVLCVNASHITLLDIIFTHSDHVFLGLPCFSVQCRIRKFEIDFIRDVASCTWPYHLRRRQQRTPVISSVPSFCSSEAEGVSSRPLMPQNQWIMARSLQRNHCSSLGLFGPQISLPWSLAERTQASYTLPYILGERCLVVRTSKNFLNFLQATPGPGATHLAAMVLSQTPPKHSISPR